jgi:hypothetical protein
MDEAAMNKFGRFLKLSLKWLTIGAAIYVGTNLFNGLDFEARTGWLLFPLAMAIAYVDSTQKDRISNLEYRIEALEHRQNGDLRQHDFD